MGFRFDHTRIFTERDIHDFFSKHTHEDLTGEKPSQSKKSAHNYLRRKYFEYLGSRCPKNGVGDKIDGSKIKNVLIFRYDAIGDYIVTSPLIRWLKSMNPDIGIDLVTSYRNDSMIRKDPLVRTTYPIHPAKNFLFSWKPAINKARPVDYDVIFGIVFTYMTKGAWFAVGISPRAEKISVEHDTRKEIYGNVFNRQVYHPTWKEHWAVTLLRSGTENIHYGGEAANGATNPYIFIYEKDIEAGYRIIEEYGLRYGLQTENILLPDGMDGRATKGSPYCILNVSAYSPNRQLSGENGVAICRQLLAKYPGLHIFVSGSPADAKLIGSITDTVNDKRCRSCSLKLNEFIAFTAGANFIISPDTATVHIAAAAKVPVIGLFAELIKVAEWYPFNTEFAAILSKDKFTINAIDPAKIIEGVEMVYHLE